MKRSARSSVQRLTNVLLSAAASAASASAQARFSIDYHGPTNGLSGGTTIDAADVLTPALTGYPSWGAGGTPDVLKPSDTALGLVPSASCTIAPGVACGLELDALSNGADGVIAPGSQTAGIFWFSVRSDAVGTAGSALARESLRFECGADLYCDLGVGVLPNPGTASLGNGLLIDGNGLGKFQQPRLGLGLIEPGLAACGAAAVRGDELDAFDWRWTGPQTTFFSLDGAAFDSCGAANAGSAAAQGLSPAAILLATGGAPTVWATATALGLGAGDDVDALALAQNGTAGFQRNQANLDWMSGASDMLLFSVTRSSPIVGTLDSALTLAISPGDVLVPPFTNGAAPRILVPAERLGLRTLRGGAAADDDLDALDIADLNDGGITDDNGNGIEDAAEIELGLELDCNDNGRIDSIDIAYGFADLDDNGIPDGCENDCNANAQADYFDITSGFATDCDGNEEPDSCQIAAATGSDCNGNAVLDSCELIAGTSYDCDYNGRLDECDIAITPTLDGNSNGTLDACEQDCNGNGTFDYLDVAMGLGADCNHNGQLDSCDITANPLLDMDNNGVLDSCEPNFTVVNCQVSASVNGCVPAMTWSGTPTASYSSPFKIRIDHVDGHRSAVIFYGINGPVSTPWDVTGASFLCVKAPTQRTGNQNSGGVTGACNGAIVLNWNAWSFAHPGGLGVPHSAGQQIVLQGWYREPTTPKTTVLTDALRFTVTP